MSCPAHSLAATRLFLLKEDVDLIRELVSGLPEKPIIADIGAGSGTTALAVLSENKDSEIHTIDISAENVEWARLNLVNYFEINNWHGIISDSRKAAGLFTDETFDMVMLDTSHEYEDTKEEIDIWLPKLKKNGIFWFHDYEGSDVDKAVDEAAESGIIVEIARIGLGWAGKKP